MTSFITSSSPSLSSSSSSSPSINTSTKLNTPTVILRIFVMVILLCIIQQLTVLSTYWKYSLMADDITMAHTSTRMMTTSTNTTTTTATNVALQSVTRVVNESVPIIMDIATAKVKNVGNSNLNSNFVPVKENNVTMNSTDKSRNRNNHHEVAEINTAVANLPTEKEENLRKYETHKEGNRNENSNEDENNDADDRVDSKQRALVVICMGESAANSNYVERFVWSARHIGNFPGWIVLLTDAPESRYQNVSNWAGNSKFSILYPEEEHYIRHYDKAPAMVFKQFKTYVLQYLSKDSRLDEIELVYYLDVDIVFGNSIWPLFQDLEQRYGIRSSTVNKNSNSSVASDNSNEIKSSIAKMWMFEGNYKKTKIQGGQMILDRATSQPCLERFRSLMDPKTSTVDQVHLMQMLDDQNNAAKMKDYSSLKCEIVIMPQEDRHILFPTRTYMEEIAHQTVKENSISNSNSNSNSNNNNMPDPIPVLNHIKNTGGDLKKLSPVDLEAYLRYVMRFEDGQEDPLGITTKTYLDGGQRENNKDRKKQTSDKKIVVEKKDTDERGVDYNRNHSSMIITAEVQASNNDSLVTNVREDNDMVSLSADGSGESWNNDENDNNNEGMNLTAVLDVNGSKMTVATRMKELDYTDDVERAFVVISMGEKAALAKTVERFIYSARNAGKYSGWIVVLTDAPPGRYSGLSKWTNNVIIMEPEKEHMKTHYKIPSMIYKRFKTLVLEYVKRDPRLDDVELVYYLDVDIVFGDSMWSAFHGIEETYRIGPRFPTTTNNSNNFTKTLPVPRGKMWMFEGNSNKWQIQGGQMVLDRSVSSPCLELWRSKFDEEQTRNIGKDQDLLMEMLGAQQDAKNVILQKQQQQHKQKQNDNDNATIITNNATIANSVLTYECEIVSMGQYPYIEFPLVPEIKKRSKFLRKHPKRKYPTSPMVHVRNDGGTATMMEGNIKPYMTNLLRFKKGQVDHLGILKKVKMEHE